jgi:hypothetical protein
MSGTTNDRERDRAGHVVGERVRLERVLGSGAAATTWLATELATGRQVAVKVLHARSLEDWKQLELFEREARVLGSLRHHAVPELIATIEEDRGQGAEIHLVMEWIEGRSLGEYIRLGPRLGEVEVMQLASDLLDVLVYLHGRAPPVFHRDIKPSNIILREDGSPVLIDFGGVCDGWRAGASGEGGMTIVGTAGYMPPEQYLGQVGPWSDLYALGATLLHLVTGRAPAEHDFASGRLEVPDGLGMSPRFVRLLKALLAPAPRDRPQSASEARALLMGDIVESRAPKAAVPVVRDPTTIERPVVPVGKPAARKLRDLGPPPRDARGKHAHVYKLMRGRYSHPAGCLLHVAFLAGLITALALESALASVVTLLAWIASAKGLSVISRRHDATLPDDGTPGGRLFVHGNYAVAEITARESSGESSMKLNYRFETDGRGTISGSHGVSTLVALANPPGTRLGVIYDADNPKNHYLIKDDLAPGV